MSNSFKATSVREHSLRRGFTSGLMAGAIMVLATIVLRLTVSGSSITELAADWFTGVLPGPAIDFLLETLSFSAKPLMFVGLLIVQVIIGGLLGVLYVMIANRWPYEEIGERMLALAFGIALWLLSMIILVPVFGGGFFATDVPGSTAMFIVFSFVPFVAYGILLGVLVAEGARTGQQGVVHQGRRAFLRKLAIWTVIVAGVFYGIDFIIERMRGQMSPSRAFRTQGTLSSVITPNDEFYVVSKNIIDPTIDLEEWSLEVGGLVDNGFVLTLEDLQAMPHVEEFVTLECISNWIGGNLISNAGWRGVPLKTILERAGLQPGVVDISFKAWDGYTESIPLEMAMRPETIIAYEMNGEPLSNEHGFPTRLIVPGFYGLKHVKWLTVIEPTNTDVQGYWQQRGWTDTPYVKTFSRFDIPQHSAEIAEEVASVGGVAFAGDRGISRIEISDDEGLTWKAVDAEMESLSPYTWVVWTADFKPSRRGEVVLKVRATDGQGLVQTGKYADTWPDGASGHHQITVVFLDSPA